MEKSKKHRWYDVIVAWASGEKIQYSDVCNIAWQDYKPLVGNCVPAFNYEDYEWRIKPKTVTKKYRMALMAHPKDVCAINVTDSCLDFPVEYEIQGFIRWIGDTVEVEVNCD